MWFKNLQVYRFTKPLGLSPEELSEKLSEHEFQACIGQDMSKMGWVSPLGTVEDNFVHAANGYIMFCAKRQDRVLPAAVINEVVDEKIHDIQEAEGRKVGRSERMSIKDEVTFTMVPKAFTRSTKQFAYISERDQMLFVNAASEKRADALVDILREAVGPLSLIPLAVKNIPQQVMTGWLRDSVNPEGFELGTECELRDPSEEGGVIRCKNQLLTNADITNHVAAGMFVSKVSLISDNGIECVIDENLNIKRLRYGDMIQDKASEVYATDAAEQFDVDFSIMTLELSALIKSLLKLFGGESLEFEG